LLVAIERGYSAIAELLKRALAEAKQGNPKRLRSKVQTSRRHGALATK